MFDFHAYQRTANFLDLVVAGGILSSDSKYYYRTFYGSDNLEVKNAPLNMDVFVLAGGGGGGNTGGSGGSSIGGAGGNLSGAGGTASSLASELGVNLAVEGILKAISANVTVLAYQIEAGSGGNISLLIEGGAGYASTDAGIATNVQNIVRNGGNGSGYYGNNLSDATTSLFVNRGFKLSYV